MSNQIQVFNFEGDTVRTIVRDNGEIRWVAMDVCRLIGIGNVTDALSRLDDDENDFDSIEDTSGRIQSMATINESG